MCGMGEEWLVHFKDDVIFKDLNLETLKIDAPHNDDSDKEKNPTRRK